MPTLKEKIEQIAEQRANTIETNDLIDYFYNGQVASLEDLPEEEVNYLWEEEVQNVELNS